VTGEPHAHRLVSRRRRYAGPVFTVYTDEITMPGGGVARRDLLEHVGAVGVVAYDGDGRVVLVRQYRHAVRRRLWELPAGLLDVAGENPVAAAARELAEEADLVAARWDLLVDLHTTPGMSDEMIRVFLARELTLVPAGERHARRDEEADLETGRFDLDEAAAMVFAGAITNGPTVAGLLAAARARDLGWRVLRPADAPLAR
jgi:ADP-ribose pyrophosphatase